MKNENACNMSSYNKGMKLPTCSVDHTYLGIQEKIIIIKLCGSSMVGFYYCAYTARLLTLAAILYEMTPCSNSITCDLRFSKC